MKLRCADASATQVRTAGHREKLRMWEGLYRLWEVTFHAARGHFASAHSHRPLGNDSCTGC